MSGPALEYCFSIDIVTDKQGSVIAHSSPQEGIRKLIPIKSGKVYGALEGEVLPGGIDSQRTTPDGIVHISARYAFTTQDGIVYIQNDGIRCVPAEYRQAGLHGDNSYLDKMNPEDFYFRCVPQFETYDEKLKWLMETIFICSAQRTSVGPKLSFYKVL